MLNEEELEKLATAWIVAYESEEGSQAHEENHWAVDRILEMNDESEDDCKVVWQFILAAYKRPMSNRTQSVFAAIPLETILGKHGDKYIDRIEQLAESDPFFKGLLGGCWRPNNTTEEVWRRVKAVRGRPWGP